MKYIFKIIQILKLALLLLSIVTLFPVWSACGGNSTSNTTITYAQGEVLVRKAGSSDWVQGMVGMILATGDAIKAGTSANTSVTFFDGSTIVLRSNTQIEIRELFQGRTTSIRLRQDIGETLSKVEKLVDPAARYEIETPAAIAAVRGSSMLVNVAIDGTTTVQNLAGQISVTAQGVEIEIPVGTKSTVQPGEAPSEPTLTQSFVGNLLSQWNFDEDGGNTAKDISGNGSDGTINGATWVSSPNGNALSFNGQRQYVDCGSKAILKPTNNITIEMWVKPGESQTTWVNILGCHQNYQGYVVEQDGNNLNRYYFAYNGDGTENHWQGINITTQLKTGVWQHFVVQKEGTTIRHYLDGVLSAEGMVDPGYVKIYHNPDEPFYIGIGWKLTSNRYFNGQIDEVRIWGN